MKNNKKLVYAITLVLLLLLGTALGVSITTFVLSLTRTDPLLSVFSYFSLIIFILFLVILMFVFIRNIDLFAKRTNKKGEEDYEKSAE